MDVRGKYGDFVTHGEKSKTNTLGKRHALPITVCALYD